MLERLCECSRSCASGMHTYTISQSTYDLAKIQTLFWKATTMPIKMSGYVNVGEAKLTYVLNLS
jgi:hypothetical protein